MAIITKHKDTTGAAAGALEVGELGVNTVDGTLSVGTAGGNTVLVSGEPDLPTGTDGQTLRNDSGTWESTSDLVVDSSGNVGIGETSPEVKLVVDGSTRVTTSFIAPSADSFTDPAFTWDGDTDTGMFRIGIDNIGFTTGGSERVRINSTGDVGIGISPTTKLHVDGDLRVNNGQCFGGGDSVAEPTYSWNGDRDTGMFRPGGDQIGLTTNGSQMLLTNTTATFVEGGYSALDRVAGTDNSGASQIYRFFTCTQSVYDGLTKDANTLYIIV